MSAAIKTITMSSDAHLHATIAVMTQLRADRAASTPGDSYDKFLADQIATGTEALAALNAASARENKLTDEMLAAAIAALYFAMHVRNFSYDLPLGKALDGMSIRGVSFASMDDARIFLESLEK